MHKLLMVVGVGIALGAAYRCYQAYENGVPISRALLNPFLPIGTLRRSTDPLGTIQKRDLALHPEARRGLRHFT